VKVSCFLQGVDDNKFVTRDNFNSYTLRNHTINYAVKEELLVAWSRVQDSIIQIFDNVSGEMLSGINKLRSTLDAYKIQASIAATRVQVSLKKDQHGNVFSMDIFQTENYDGEDQ